MNYENHLKIGVYVEIVLLVILFLFFRFDLSLILTFKIILVCLISPLVMDLDHFNGKLRNVITAIGLIIANYGVLLWLLTQDVFFKNVQYFSSIILGVEISSLAFFIAFFFKHRGFIHSIVFCLIYGVLLYSMLYNVYLSVIGMIGCYTHLVVDKESFKIV